jgi:chromosome segregation ATPase
VKTLEEALKYIVERAEEYFKANPEAKEFKIKKAEVGLNWRSESDIVTSGIDISERGFFKLNRENYDSLSETKRLKAEREEKGKEYYALAEKLQKAREIDEHNKNVFESLSSEYQKQQKESESLENQINKLNKEMETLPNQIKALKEKRDNLKAEMTELEAEIEENDKSVEEFESLIETFKARKKETGFITNFINRHKIEQIRTLIKEVWRDE